MVLIRSLSLSRPKELRFQPASAAVLLPRACFKTGEGLAWEKALKNKADADGAMES